MTKTFSVAYDQDQEAYIVREKSSAFSISTVPAKNESEFYVCDFGGSHKKAKAMAFDQVRRLHAWQAKGNTVETRTLWTPGCFETVADTKYGPAW